MKINKPTPFRYRANPAKSPLKGWSSNFNSEMDKFNQLGADLKDPSKQIKVGNAMQISAPNAKNQDFKNQFAGATNAFSNMNMENLAEDLTVNQEQAQFEKEMGMQQEANMLDAMRGGGGFNAGNIQAMAGAGSQRRRAASASIGQQESANQMAKMQGAQDVQRRREMQMTGQSDAERLKMQGAADTQAARAASGMQQAQMGLQAQTANQQAQTANQALQYQAASDSRNLQFQHQQGMLQLISGKEAADAANEQAGKNWGQRTFGW